MGSIFCESLSEVMHDWPMIGLPPVKICFSRFPMVCRAFPKWFIRNRQEKIHYYQYRWILLLLFSSYRYIISERKRVNIQPLRAE